MSKKFSLKKNWAVIILLTIITLTAILRAWHLGDYTLFRADQARDAYYAKDVLDGSWKYFKLLGPKAGAAVDVYDIRSAFKLGPAYNYIQYLGVILMGKLTPLALVLVDWFLGVVAIGLFYVFLREFFNKKNSLLTTSLFASSYILTLYGRFSWNINQIIFWEILFSIGVLKVIKLSSLKKYKQSGHWLLITVLALAFIGQLHLLSAIVFGVITIMMFVIYKPKIVWRYFLGGILIILIMYLPMIVSDLYNKGDNLQRFIKASKLEKKTTDDFGQKILKLNRQQGKNYGLILTASNKYDNKNISTWGSIFVWMSAGLILIILSWEKIFIKNNNFNNKLKKKYNFIKRFPNLSGSQRRFLLLILLWFIFFVLIYYKILPRLHKTRYWLLIAPLPFIFIGLWFWFLEIIVKNKYLSGAIVLGVTSFLLFSNLTAIGSFYNSLTSGKLFSGYHKKITLGPYRFLTTYGEMREIVDFISTDSRGQDVCFKSLEYQNKLGFEYLFDLYYPSIKYIQTNQGNKYKCNFYVITKKSRGNRELKHFKKQYKIIGHKKFKTLSIWKLQSVDNNLSKIIIEKKQRLPKDNRVIYWKDLLDK